jgi:hypothetical protein
LSLRIIAACLVLRARDGCVLPRAFALSLPS